MKIFKYPLSRAEGYFYVPMPDGAQHLKVGHDPQGQLCVWSAVEPGIPKRNYTFYFVGTGHEVDPRVVKVSNYMGTFHEGPFVWHVFSE